MTLYVTCKFNVCDRQWISIEFALSFIQFHFSLSFNAILTLHGLFINWFDLLVCVAVVPAASLLFAWAQSAHLSLSLVDGVMCK